MCLAIPMRIDQINQDEATAQCSYQGIHRSVSLYLVGDQIIAVGDFVLVHVGYAIQKLTYDDAQLRLALFAAHAGDTDEKDA